MIDISRYGFISNALNASGGFSDGSYLIQYPRESEEKFTRRKQIAWYRNFLLSACHEFIGYLSKRPVMRVAKNPLLQSIIDDADWKGSAIDQFWMAFMVEAKARGLMLLVVDMPQTIPLTQGDQLNQRIAPYLAMIAPEAVRSYELNEQGLIQKVEIIDSQNTNQGLSMPILRGWDNQRWWVRKGNGVLQQGEHGLGVCPVLAFSEMDTFGLPGQFAQIADLSKRYYNLCSERDEILRAQTFSLLTYQVPPEQAHLFDQRSVAEAIGTHNLLLHHGDAPAFIAPPDGPANIYNQVIAELEQTIKRIAMTIEQPTSQESGIALTIRFQQLNSALTLFARKMEDLERKVWWLVSLWLGINETPEISWSKDYSLADINQELAELSAMQLANFPPAVLAEKQKQIITLSLGNLEPDKIEALLNDVGVEHVIN